MSTHALFSLFIQRFLNFVIRGPLSVRRKKEGDIKNYYIRQYKGQY